MRYFDIRIGLPKKHRQLYEKAYNELYKNEENFRDFRSFKSAIFRILDTTLKDNPFPSLKDVKFQHGYFNGCSFDLGMQ